MMEAVCILYNDTSISSLCYKLNPIIAVITNAHILPQSGAINSIFHPVESNGEPAERGYVFYPNPFQIVNLERVGLRQKNFDMAIVFKDFKRDVMRIDSIPSSSIDGIKECLDTADIKYYESRLNLNWHPILKTIMEDPEKVVQDGGWEFLNLEATDSNSDHFQESDQGYEPRSNLWIE